MDMCINMTIPERVNPFNLHRLRKMVANGTDNYPGARIVEKANGVRLSLKFFTRANHRHLLEEKAQALQVGDVVHRHLLAGDPVLFNRQPSLHKMSIMAHRAKVMPWRTLRFNEVCARRVGWCCMGATLTCCVAGGACSVCAHRTTRTSMATK